MVSVVSTNAADLAPCGCLGNQRHLFALQRQIGEADRDVPAGVCAPAGNIVEQHLGATVAPWRRGATAFADGPP
jgi:hypothetical protein